jgi:hypothetical protein
MPRPVANVAPLKCVNPVALWERAEVRGRAPRDSGRHAPPPEKSTESRCFSLAQPTGSGLRTQREQYPTLSPGRALRCRYDGTDPRDCGPLRVVHPEMAHRADRERHSRFRRCLVPARRPGAGRQARPADCHSRDSNDAPPGQRKPALQKSQAAPIPAPAPPESGTIIQASGESGTAAPGHAVETALRPRPHPMAGPGSNPTPKNGLIHATTVARPFCYDNKTNCAAPSTLRPRSGPVSTCRRP